ncbi:uncharacterized protein [Amphiura filiformis]|uniref:uncharacterized protein n=1 Tax=Amphiura filiformis TaxID=82378 RepID=UPI003B21B3E7
MVKLAFPDDLITTLLDWLKIGHNIYFNQSAGSSHRVKMDLEDHIKRYMLNAQSSDKILKCCYCPHTFTQTDYLKMHEWTHEINEGKTEMKVTKKTTPRTQKSYQCQHCKKHFNEMDNIKIHVRQCHMKTPKDRISRCEKEVQEEHVRSKTKEEQTSSKAEIYEELIEPKKKSDDAKKIIFKDHVRRLEKKVNEEHVRRPKTKIPEEQTSSDRSKEKIPEEQTSSDDVEIYEELVEPKKSFDSSALTHSTKKKSDHSKKSFDSSALTHSTKMKSDDAKKSFDSSALTHSTKKKSDDAKKIIFRRTNMYERKIASPSSKSVPNVRYEAESDSDWDSDDLVQPIESCENHVVTRSAKKSDDAKNIVIRRTNMYESQVVHNARKTITETQTTHTVLRTPGICTVCGKSIKTQDRLEYHQHVCNAHSDDITHDAKRKSDDAKEFIEVNIAKKVLCTICGKSLKTQASLERHQSRVHANEKKKFVKVHTAKKALCTICGKSLKTQASLERHQSRVHANERLQVICTDQKRFRCEICHKFLANKLSLKTHVTMVHDGDNQIKFQCNVCGKSLKTKPSLRYHMSRVHGKEKPFKCDVCNVCYANNYTLQNHLLTHAKNKVTFPCVYCGKTFTKAQRTKAHIVRNHRKGISFQCKICEDSFSQKRMLNAHVRDHSKRLQCKHCHKWFVRKSQRDQHLLLHTTKVLLSCKFCPKPFLTKTCLRKHISWHHVKDRCYQCKYCEKRFALASLMRAHVGSVHGKLGFRRWRRHAACVVVPPWCIAKERGLFCTYCHKLFSSRQAVIYHIRLRHTNEKPYKCDICQKAFHRKDHLKDHVMNHGNEKPFKCKMCLKSFARKRGLKNHELLHKPRTRHQCEICKKHFLAKTYLWQHVSRMHPDKTPFSCEICQKPFAKQKFLNIHMKFHTKKHHCELCDKRFAHSTNLGYHMKAHHGSKQKPYKCHICNLSYTVRSSLTRHNANVHYINASFRCCGKELTSKQFLKAHLTTHNKGNKLMRCAMCCRRFLSKFALLTHCRGHSKGKVLRCQYCQVRCAQKSQLDQHMLQHSNEDILCCVLCQRTFITREGLSNHMSWSHIRDKCYGCKMCKKQFVLSNLLKAHILTVHNGRKSVKSFKQKTSWKCMVKNLDYCLQIKLVKQKAPLNHACIVCQKRYASKGHLRQHMMTHSGEKTFSCDFCHKHFANKYHKRAHTKRVHTRAPPKITCTQCDKKLHTNGELQRHIKRYHTSNVQVKCELCHKLYRDVDSLQQHMNSHNGEIFQCEICGSSSHLSIHYNITLNFT